MVKHRSLSLSPLHRPSALSGSPALFATMAPGSPPPWDLNATASATPEFESKEGGGEIIFKAGEEEGEKEGIIVRMLKKCRETLARSTRSKLRKGEDEDPGGRVFVTTYPDGRVVRQTQSKRSLEDASSIVADISNLGQFITTKYLHGHQVCYCIPCQKMMVPSLSRVHRHTGYAPPDGGSTRGSGAKRRGLRHQAKLDEFLRSTYFCSDYYKHGKKGHRSTGSATAA